MSRRPALLLATASLALCACSAPRPREPEVAEQTPASTESKSAMETFDVATGTWDWANGDSTCLGNRHVISFSADRKTMLLTHRTPIDTSTGRTVSKYHIVAAGNAVLPGFPNVIRGELEAESRLTEKGAPVVWDLVMQSINRYHWHRTDWPDGAITKALIRCEGNTPLERWEPSDQS